MKRLLMSIAKAAACGLFIATVQAATTVTTTADQTITGAKTFSGSCRVLLAGSTSGTTCLNAPAIAGSTTAIVFPSSAGTLALSGADVATSQLTGTIAAARMPAFTGDITTSAGAVATTLATVNSTVGTFGSATKASAVTVNAKGLVTAASESTVTPAVGSITGLGTGVATWLGTPTGANLTSALSSGGGTVNFLRADGSFAAAGSTNASDLASGTLDCARTPALTGDVTTSAGSCATTVANSAVTLAKMADVSTARFIGRTTSGTGAPEALTATQATAMLNAVVGDSGSGGTKGSVPAPASGDAAASKYLKADGTWATISGGAGGGLVLVEQHTASASASLDFTACISSTFDEYLIEFIDLVPTAALVPWLRMGTGTAPNIDIGSNYAYEVLIYRAGATATTGNTGQTKIPLIYDASAVTLAANANQSFNGSLRLFSPGASIYKAVTGQFRGQDSGNFRANWQSSGAYESTTPVTHFQVLTSTSTWASGTVRCYGIAKSEAELDPLFDAITRMAANDAPRSAANDAYYEMAA